MKLTPEQLDIVRAILARPDADVMQLARIAKLDPKKHFRNADLRGVTFAEDVTGFDFSGADLRNADFSAASGTDRAVFTGACIEGVRWPAPSEPPSQPAQDIVPSWADDAGTDEYGRWASFSVTAADGRRVSQRLRWCPPGRFMMGSPDDEKGRDDDEGPRHEVVFARGFWMFETSCRQELWQAVMGDNPSTNKRPLLPVTDVSWEAARRFVESLNTLKPGLGLDLPSEAQWEYACRAGAETAYSFGAKISRKLVKYESIGTVPVGSLLPNVWGLYEMHGNVWEWCADTWHDSYAGAPKDGSAWIDSGAVLRVIRGGSWYNTARNVRAAYRNRNDPAYRNGSLGFRCSRVQGEREAAGREEQALASGASGRRRSSRARSGGA